MECPYIHTCYFGLLHFRSYFGNNLKVTDHDDEDHERMMIMMMLFLCVHQPGEDVLCKDQPGRSAWGQGCGCGNIFMSCLKPSCTPGGVDMLLLPLLHTRAGCQATGAPPLHQGGLSGCLSLSPTPGGAVSSAAAAMPKPSRQVGGHHALSQLNCFLKVSLQKIDYSVLYHRFMVKNLFFSGVSY